ncbi:5-formyltetrahydrofolate cyclo-ligase [uncultured Phascolarctobacterium sp.]|uniref:5-formyltetrahydrofolate cyclo-ligase n=1 Tax=uncultured Phascolarctobacterium sp. TaxID=512296 RepID=UPI0025E52F40|nr:5-formyltetrahydrofolate cyclo-ligase [uncultured Phascolarctobacterium sp.]
MLSAVIKTPLKTPNMVVEAKKIELRRRLQRLRAQMSGEQAAASSLQASRHILACDAYRKAKCIMGFLAFGKELSVDIVLEQALADGKIVAVPLITSDKEFVPVRLLDMQHFSLDRYGIRTAPQPVQLVEPEEIDLILVPGVAFGRDGSRLGMGAGYYDRFLLKAGQAVRMGVAYDALMQDALPLDAYDVNMQLLASESGIIHLPV